MGIHWDSVRWERVSSLRIRSQGSQSSAESTGHRQSDGQSTEQIGLRQMDSSSLGDGSVSSISGTSNLNEMSNATLLIEQVNELTIQMGMLTNRLDSIEEKQTKMSQKLDKIEAKINLAGICGSLVDQIKQLINDSGL